MKPISINGIELARRCETCGGSGTIAEDCMVYDCHKCKCGLILTEDGKQLIALVDLFYYPSDDWESPKQMGWVDHNGRP